VAELTGDILPLTIQMVLVGIMVLVTMGVLNRHLTALVAPVLSMQLSNARSAGATGCEIEHAKRFHTVGRTGVLVVDHANVAKAQRFDQRSDDFMIRHRAVGFGCWRGRNNRQFFAANRPAVVSN
jgi:hypothetical protein